jgi:rfaE bifunctional protein nucleotidyltransferase chain/domain
MRMGQIVLDQDDLAKRLRSLKVGGKRVVVTNGCFDLLHVGHVRALQDAKRRGDCLVVAINSDASVRKLKGSGRPLQSQADRAEILAALDGVTYVTVFDEESVGPLLRRLRPSIVAKGTDYTAENFPERDVLAEIGAELIIVGDPKGHSTRDLLKLASQAHAASLARATAAKGRGGAKPARSSGRPGAKGTARPLRGGRAQAAAAGARKRGRLGASHAHA